MLVFIDESGDPGFKLDSGSSAVFVSSMVIFEDHSHADAADAQIRALMAKLKVKPEFKFNKSSIHVRNEFFAMACGLDFKCRAIVVQKDKIHSENLRSVKESFYKFFVRMMMQNDNGYLKDAKVFIDGCGERLFRQELKAYIRKHIPRESVRDVELRESHRNPLIQLADMSAGAIARTYHPEKADRQWLAQIERSGKVSDIWQFK